MNESIFNQNAFLRTQTSFPTDIDELVSQLDKNWVDTANAINNRIISLFAINKSVITGETWYIFQNKKQQTLRRVYIFGAIAAGGTLNIPINITNFDQFSDIWGTVVTDITDWRPLPYMDPVTLTDGIGIKVTPVGLPAVNNIQIIVGATSPNIVKGLVVLEWLSQVF